MPSLTIKTPDGKTRTVTLLKRITSIGRGADNDIVLEDARVPETAFAIMFDGSNTGRRRARSSRQRQGAATSERTLETERRRSQWATPSSIFTLADAPHGPASPGHDRRPRRLPTTPTPRPSSSPACQAASWPRCKPTDRRSRSACLASYDLDQLLESLMDECIEVTRADKGFLILMERNELRVKVARNVSRENIEDAVERVSDSIVAKVVKHAEAADHRRRPRRPRVQRARSRW